MPNTVEFNTKNNNEYWNFNAHKINSITGDNLQLEAASGQKIHTIGDLSCNGKLNTHAGTLTVSAEIASFSATYETDVKGSLVIRKNKHSDATNEPNHPWARWGSLIQYCVNDVSYQSYIEFNPASVRAPNNDHGGWQTIKTKGWNAIAFGCYDTSDGEIMRIVPEPTSSAGNTGGRAGYVGILKRAPACPLDVGGYSTAQVGVGGTHPSNTGQYLTWNGVHTMADDPTISASIAADDGSITTNAIFCGYEINFLSDSRIKKDIQEVNDNEALIKLRNLKPCKYKYIEPLFSQRSREQVYGFIAQEVAQVLPTAVTIGRIGGTTQGIIPNILSLCSLQNVTIDIDAYNNLTSQQKSEYISSSNNTYTRQLLTITNTFDPSLNTNTSSTNSFYYGLSEQTKTTQSFEKNSNDKYHSLVFYNKKMEILIVNVISVVNSSSFIVDFLFDASHYFENNELLLYGQHPTDFHRLDKNAIFTLATAALQEVDRQQIADKARIAELETKLNTVTTALNTLLTAAGQNTI
jgi:hypothetical protein